MEMASVWRQFEALSPAAKRRVAELIALLSAGGKRGTFAADAIEKPLKNEDFVGIWSDRDDLSDSTAWVRQRRTEEWSG